MVSTLKWEELRRKFAALGICEEDLAEQFVRSSGPGGQHVNKTSTAVVLKHIPSGLQVKCQVSRSQAENRFLARRLLADKLEAKILGKQSAERQKQERIRRQKRRRSRRAKEKMLREKHRRSHILANRRIGQDS